MDDDKTHQNRTGALSYLISEQDVHAYVDGELTDERRSAVETYLSERPNQLEDAAAILRMSVDLRAVSAELYRDDALRDEIDRLRAKKAGQLNGVAKRATA